MRRLLWVMLFALSSGCALAQGAANVPAELLEKPYLCEVVRHLYRWQLDETSVEQIAGAKDFPFWVRRLDVKLDEGDRSQYAEIVLPMVGLSAKVKKADYTVADLGTMATSKTFRIVNVARIAVPPAAPEGSAVTTVGYAEMKDYLFSTRTQSVFPDDVMIERLRVALRKQLALDPNAREAGEQVAHLAPLSPVANELWVYWETRQLLIRFAADIDLENPVLWENQALTVRTYDVLNQVVVSLDEAAGSNAFMTRNQIGRALYNCIVLGRRLVISNPK